MSAARRRGRTAAALLAAALLAGSAGCSDAGLEAESHSPLPPDRREYVAFRAAHTGLREPNYLPFLLHRLRIEGVAEDLLVACRWPGERFPLAVAIDAPRIEGALADEDHPTPPAVYVEAAEKALARWEQELGPPVRFRRAAAGDAPDVRIRLTGERAPVPEDGKAVLGMTPMNDACEVRGGDAASGRIDAALRRVEVRVYVADEFGLLTPEQVETVVAHELGHALGARSHSPFPSDLMHEVARDRLGARRLSPQDVASFAVLYALPSGTVYARRRPGENPPRTADAAPAGPVRLSETPWDAPAQGFSLRLPEGWTVVPIDHGVAAVDGLAWDYDASLQVVAVPVAGIDAYLEQYGAAHLRKGPLVGRREIEIGGRRALRFAVEVEASDSIEEVTLVEAGGGRVLLAIAESPAREYDAYRPWLEEPLATLGVREPRADAVSPSP